MNETQSTRIFIGTSPNGYDREIENVYEYSLRKNCSTRLEIIWMRQSNKNFSIWNGWDSSLWYTPFSGFRWAIPEACDFKGRAIYTDVDMINFKDISLLQNVDLNGKPFAARQGRRFGGFETCVMVIDCEKAKNFLPSVKKMKADKNMHDKLRHKFCSSQKYIKPINPKWNCLDGEEYNLEDIYQLHFTNMATQPWKPQWYTGQTKKHPRKDVEEIFYTLKEEANKAGFFSKSIPNHEKVILEIIGR